MNSYFKLYPRFLPLLFFVILLISCLNQQDDKNYRRYLHQDRKIEGKAGILITALGQPAYYDFEFFNRYLTLIFKTAFPPLLKLIALRDKGTVLMDPEYLEAKEEFKPKSLMDCFGKRKNKEGIPYISLDYKWIPPRTKDSPGHFLLPEKNGYIDIVEKVGIKIAASYYPKMPHNKIPYEDQHLKIINEVASLIKKEFPECPFRYAWTMRPETIKKAVDELIEEKVKTIIHCDIFPVYSSLEQFNTLYQEVKDMVAERAKVIYTPFPGAYPSFRKAYVQLAVDEISQLPQRDKKLLILTRHGFPDIPGDPYPILGRCYYLNLKKEMETALANTNTNVTYADTDFAGDDQDPQKKKLSSVEALEMGLKEGYDHIIFILVDFTSENTDTIFAMRLETFEPFHFQYVNKVPYTDFSRPYRTELQVRKTRIVVAGAPVGEKYRPFISQGIFESIKTLLKEENWPQIILEVKKKKRGMF